MGSRYFFLVSLLSRDHACAVLCAAACREFLLIHTILDYAFRRMLLDI